MKTTIPRVWLRSALMFCGFLFSSLAFSQEYLPLRDGMEWFLEMRVISPSGDVTEGTTRRKISGKIEIAGKTYLKSRTWIEGGKPWPIDYTKFVRKDRGGFYSVESGSTNKAEELEVKLPLKVGDRWKTTNLGAIRTHTVLTNESITVNGKTYTNCFRIRAEASEGKSVEEFWEAPNIGCVKSVLRQGGGQIILTLREFKAGDNRRVNEK